MTELLVARGIAARRAADTQDYLFGGVDLRLEQGSRLGLVGPSGSGKSTVMRLLALTATPASGTVVAAPGVRAALLEQDANLSLPTEQTVWQVASGSLDEVERLASLVGDAATAMALATSDQRARATAAYEALLVEYRRLGGPGAAARVRQVLAALGLGPTRHADLVASLSAGERQRLALATVLSSAADVLLLDEPTNHLDLSERTWLERHIGRHRGAVVVVSNDRAFLDVVTNQTAFLDASGLKVVRAPYTKAAKSGPHGTRGSARRRRELELEAERLDRVAAELAAYGVRRRATRATAPRAPALRAPSRGAPSHGTPSLRTSSLSVPSQQLDGAGLRAGEVLLRAERLCLADTFGGVTVQIAAGDRVAVLGPSGSGTSGLLALLTGELRGDDQEQRLWYAPSMQLVSVDQRTRGLEPGVAVIEQGSARLGHELARHVLATSGLPYPMWSRSPDTLTPRERARVGMAIALARPCDLLVLEEPTADLDLVSVEELERDLSRRLSASNLALILATHDRVLARNLTDRVWSIVDGSLVAHSSVPAYLRGDEAVAPDVYWDEPADLEPTRHDAAGGRDEVTTREALEAERARLLELLSDPLALGEREIERARQRVEEVEASLMAVYDASLTPAAPRYRLVEGGLTLYADLVEPSPVDGSRPVTRPETGLRSEPSLGSGSRPAHRLVVVATDDEQAATTAVRHEEPTIPWLDVRAMDGVAHLRIADLPGSCLLPGTVTALVNAGVYLAFTVLGARRTQLFSHEDLSTTSLRNVGGGWWRLTLPQFLTSEGWHGAGRGGFGTSGGRRTRAGRRGSRKAETT